jgi:hypothetical protein
LKGEIENKNKFNKRPKDNQKNYQFGKKKYLAYWD